MLDLIRFEEFEWDSGNERKNERHGVTQREAEQVFLQLPLLLLEDFKHSGEEVSRAGQERRGPFASRLIHCSRIGDQNSCDIGPAHAPEGEKCL